jgi:hypothetical protein
MLLILAGASYYHGTIFLSALRGADFAAQTKRAGSSGDFTALRCAGAAAALPQRRRGRGTARVSVGGVGGRGSETRPAGATRPRRPTKGHGAPQVANYFSIQFYRSSPFRYAPVLGARNMAGAYKGNGGEMRVAARNRRVRYFVWFMLRDCTCNTPGVSSPALLAGLFCAECLADVADLSRARFDLFHDAI